MFSDLLHRHNRAFAAPRGFMETKKHVLYKLPTLFPTIGAPIVHTPSMTIRVSGHLSKVGLHTFADPRSGGGKRNKFTTKDLVKIQV